jgi:hypothetical protein
VCVAQQRHGDNRHKTDHSWDPPISGHGNSFENDDGFPKRENVTLTTPRFQDSKHIQP